MRKQTTTIRIDQVLKTELDNIKIDLTTTRRETVTLNDTIRALVAAWHLLQQMGKGDDE